MHNEYIPFVSKIVEIIKHTEIEYTFRMEYKGDVLPGQFFEVSIPTYGEAPISVSGITDRTIDLTIRKVGRVTDEIFEYRAGNSLFLRGPYGNGFDPNIYKGKDLYIVAGGTGVSPVKAIIDYFAKNRSEVNRFCVITGFKSTKDILFKDEIKLWKDNSEFTLTIDKEEDGYTGNVGLVTKYIPKLNIEDKENLNVIVVGPPIMMKFATEEFTKLGIEDKHIWISQERKMCCGIGKCGHCKINDKYVCIDGPVFNYAEGKYLVD